MQTKHFIKVLAAGWLLLLTTTGYGQAWIKDKGKFYAKLGVNSTNSSTLFDESSGKIDSVFGQKIPALQELIVQVYAQYGVAKGVNLIASVPLKTIHNKDNGFRRTGIADMELGAAFKMITKKWNVSPALYVGIPAGYYNSYRTLNRQYTDGELLLGDGEWNVMPRLYFGRGMSKTPIYVTGFAGFNYRTQGRDHEIDAMIEGGYTLKKFIFILKMQLKESFNSNQVNTFTGLYDNGQEYLAPHLSIYYKHTPKLHFSLNIGGAVYARHAQGAASINLGVAYEN